MCRIGNHSRSTCSGLNDPRWVWRLCYSLNFGCDMLVDLWRLILMWFVVIFVYRDVFFSFVVIWRWPRYHRHREEREPSGNKCEEILKQPGDGLNGIVAETSATVRVIAVWTNALVVHQADTSENSVLHQWVHNGSVDLTKKLSSVLGALG